MISKCGGYVSGIVDGIRWAAGIPVPNVPNNPNPARVINLSMVTPGGIGIGANGIPSTSDGGTQGPANDSAYLSGYGTSIAAAHVSGVASLILSIRPALTPEQVGNLMKSTARAFPTDATAQGAFANCSLSACGGGMVDARRAARRASR